METILLQPADEAELERLKAFLNETHIKSHILSEEDKEDFALGLMMQETDYDDVVGTDEFINSLSGK